MNLGRVRRFVNGVDTGKVTQLARARARARRPPLI
ncbi:hypothetical protein LTSEURB_4388, partial [Salmonella enterica subsp. enterica serovar Urbana str. R8-2977]